MRLYKAILIMEFIVGVLPITFFAVFFTGVIYPVFFMGTLVSIFSGHFRTDGLGIVIFNSLALLSIVCQWSIFFSLLSEVNFKERRMSSLFRFYGMLVGSIMIAYFAWEPNLHETTALIIPYLIVTVHWLYLFSPAAVPITSIKKRLAACIVVSLVLVLILYCWLVAPANIKNGQLMGMSEVERNLKLSAFLKDQGTTCDSVVRNYFHGQYVKTGEEVWHVACKNSQTFAIFIRPKGISVTSCQIFKDVLDLGECFNKRLPAK